MLSFALELWKRFVLFLVRVTFTPPAKPQSVSANLRRSFMALEYQVVFPPFPESDKGSKKLKKVISGVETIEDFANPDEPFASLIVEDETEVSLSVSHIDLKGNASAFSEPFTFTANDTLPPSAPNQVGVVLIRDNA